MKYVNKSLTLLLGGFNQCFLKTELAKEGRPGYDPQDMLKLYIYGYLNQTRSSRRLQKEASRFKSFIELCNKAGALKMYRGI